MLRFTLVFVVAVIGGLYYQSNQSKQNESISSRIDPFAAKEVVNSTSEPFAEKELVSSSSTSKTPVKSEVRTPTSEAPVKSEPVQPVVNKSTLAADNLAAKNREIQRLRAKQIAANDTALGRKMRVQSSVYQGWKKDVERCIYMLDKTDHSQTIQRQLDDLVGYSKEASNYLDKMKIPTRYNAAKYSPAFNKKITQWNAYLTREEKALLPKMQNSINNAIQRYRKKRN